jgi:hypothetical protein
MEKYVYKYQKPEKKLFGIPLTFVDEIEYKSDFHFNQKDLINNFGHIIKNRLPRENLVVRLSIDLILILTIVDFFNY